MAFISVTRLRVRSWRFLPSFIILAVRTRMQAQAAAGNLGVKVLRDRRNAFWTATSWESEDAMKAFMLANPHGTAMRKLLNWCDEAAVVHWTQPENELPAWQEAYKQLLRRGRPSKVNHPSEAQKAFMIPAPETKS